MACGLGELAATCKDIGTSAPRQRGGAALGRARGMVRKTNPLISVALLSAAAGCFLLGTGVTVADVILRKLGGINVRGAIELTSYSIGFGALLSMPVCYALRSHVTAKLLSELMPTLFLRPLGRLGAVASLVFAGLMVWIVGANAVSKLGSPETSADLGLPMPAMLSVVAVTLAAALFAAGVGVWLEWRRGAAA